MTTTIESTTNAVDLTAVEEFALRVADDRAIAYHSVLVYLGDRLGLWQQLASVGSVTSRQLAERSGLSERHLREWLATQAAAGYLTYDADSESFSLSTEHAMVLADEDSPAAGIAGFEVIAAVWASVDRLANAYATGDGLAWHEHDSRLFTGVDRFYSTFYRSSLLTEWLPAVDGLVERLESGIRVADIGCGLGSATILMAQAFPASTFIGVDYHEESVRRATAAAEEAGVSDRVQFVVGDASAYPGHFDLVCYFDAVHDMGDPVGALGHARRALAPGGQVVRGRAVRRGHPRGQPGQPRGADLLRRQLGPVRPAQRVRRRRGPGRSGGTGSAGRGVRGRRLQRRPGRHGYAVQPGARGARLRTRWLGARAPTRALRGRRLVTNGRNAKPETCGW